MADKEAARKSGRPLVISQTSDVCMTPIGGTTVPVPYPVTIDLSDALNASPNVNFGGKLAFTMGSQTPDIRGDQAGSASGVKSGTVGGKCEPIQGSSTVRVNGQPVIRHGDRFTMNNGNTIGKLVYVEGGDGVASIDGPTTLPIAVSCIGGGNDVKLVELRRDLEQSLTVGDSYEKIERFLSERGLLYDFDYHRSRFQAGFDANADTYDPDLSNVVIDIYVDSDGRFVKAEVERVYTFI